MPPLKKRERLSVDKNYQSILLRTVWSQMLGSGWRAGHNASIIIEELDYSRSPANYLAAELVQRMFRAEA